MKFAVSIPTINRADLLKESLSTLLVEPNINQIEYVYVVDNGNQKMPYHNHDKVIVKKNSSNLGVAASWNQGINKALIEDDLDWVVTLNDDIILRQDQLAHIKMVLEHNDDKWFMIGPAYWSVWAMSKEGAKNMSYQKGKYFDETFWPAYFEDNDFHYRIHQKDASKYRDAISAMAPALYRNSMSIEKDPSLNTTFQHNANYYKVKWGGYPNMEKWKVPFDEPVEALA